MEKLKHTKFEVFQQVKKPYHMKCYQFWLINTHSLSFINLIVTN